MGYNTTYSLDVESVSPFFSFSTDGKTSIIREFIATCADAEYCILEDGGVNESGKWYDHEKDLREFSIKYPMLLFTLSGEGEESGDIWKLYVVNGKAHREKAQIAILPFDKEKLS